MKVNRTAILALAATLAGAAALAHSGATGVVKERMEAMDDMNEAVKRIAPMFQGQAEYNADTVREAAATIGGHAGEAMLRLFPEDSTDMPSEARPAIWQDWERFEALSRQLETTARGLGLAAVNAPGTAGAGAGTTLGAGAMMGSSGAQSDAGAMMGSSSASGMMGSSSGAGSMMGSGAGAMMGGGGAFAMSAQDIGKMPATGAFVMMSQTCSACHTRFRAEK